ncbi:hypothetical protein RUM44_006109 [Polyplax serrata]|uniref:Poly(A) RNA polymerase mitochondrial-like central palm domain-containing protein n=1 Tax=Polyplax serrata TaxID=468196 RepID=A0ABR1AZ19_POLSC
MYSTVKRVTLIRRIVGEGSNLFLTPTKPMAGFKSSSGLLEKVNRENIIPKEDKQLLDDIFFTKHLECRLQEASKSVAVKLNAFGDWEKFQDYCASHGSIIQLYHYKLGGNHYALVEMSCREELFSLVNGLKEGSSPSVTAVKKSPAQFGYFYEVDYALREEQSNNINVKFNVNVNCLTSKAILNLMDQELTLSEQISLLYKETRLNDLGYRLRFLLCKQVYDIVAGLLPNAIVYPFGSAVTDFGYNGCDLDLVIVQNENGNRIITNLKPNDRQLMQSHLDVIANVFRVFGVGCTKINYIKHARVPIIKFKHDIAGIDCDLSLYCESPVLMSQLLYTLANLDERVKPLVFAIRWWAKSVGLTDDKPNTSITNFSLTLLVVFFLQQKTIGPKSFLPPLNIFPTEKQTLLTEREILMGLSAHEYSEEMSNVSLQSLLGSFFNFYSTFDFSEYGCCVKTGLVIKNKEYPLLIRNPMSLDLNVSRNVSQFSVEKLSNVFKRAASIFEYITQLQDDHSLKNLVSIKNYDIPTNAQGKNRSTKKQLDVTRIFGNS